jgi:nucleotide-binding universal stress UspA family protein
MIAALKIERILFATDYYESSRLALDYAVAFAHHFKATVLMLHVIQLSEAATEVELMTSKSSVSRKEAQERLEVLASGVRHTGLKVEAHVKDGIVCETILEAVSSYRADMLVLGVHGVHRGVEHLVLGSNTEKILLSSSCPTLTIGAHVRAGFDLGLHLHEILYFSDFTPDAAAAGSYAIRLGREFHVPVDVCQLLPPIAEDNPQFSQKIAEEYCQAMRREIPEWKSEWFTPAFHLERGLKTEQMLVRARNQTAGLIVLGVHARSFLGRHLHSSFAYQLLANATCPILSARQK